MHSYWSNDEALGVLAIKKAMSRNRFAKIQQYFHLNELRKEDVGYDRLQKIRPLLSICKETFRANFIPARELSIDGGMVKFKGRLGFVQYMPMKPTKRGIKVWMLASPANGYTHEVDVYCGRSDGMTAEPAVGRNQDPRAATVIAESASESSGPVREASCHKRGVTRGREFHVRLQPQERLGASDRGCGTCLHRRCYKQL